jgi:elongation factor 1-alpha
MASSSEKQHVSVVVCGHVDAGKSSFTGRLLYDLGGIPEREMAKLREEADVLGKSSFAFAFYLDRTKEERSRGITIACTTKEFFTENYHYTIVDAPGHRDYIRNMISGSSQVDVAIIMVPADGNFITSIAKGDPKAGEVQGQTRQHARLINLLGVKQVIVCVNKMDCDVANYSQDRFNEVRNETIDMLAKVGFKKDTITSTIPILPISGYQGENLLSKSEKMPWWDGVEVSRLDGQKVKVTTVLDALNNFAIIPPRNMEAPLRVPINGVYKIKGVGDVLAGRVEQGKINPGDEVVFLPTHTSATPCAGKVFSVEMHHKSVPFAGPGDNVGMSIKGLEKTNMPRTGDVMILKKDLSLKRCKRFTAQVQVLEHPGELKVGYTPIACVRTAHCAVRLAEIKWKMGKETGGKKVNDPVSIKTNEAAEVVFEPQQPFVVDTYANCEGLGRVAIMEGNSVQMLGKVVNIEFD